jgi:hypothetical protein
MFDINDHTNLYQYTCESCDFYGSRHEVFGQCYRFPPEIGQKMTPIGVIADRQIYADTARPLVSHDNWCGEWQCADGNIKATFVNKQAQNMLVG